MSPFEFPSEMIPWQTNPEWYKEDQLIHDFEKSIIKTKPGLFSIISDGLPKEGLYGLITIRGPRRVGKSTLLKLIIKHLTEKGADPNSIFYFSLDNAALTQSKGAFTILDIIASVTKDTNADNYLFLDEVSMYPDWATEMKNAYDLGYYNSRRLKIVATGSHSMDLAEAASKLSSRQGNLADSFKLGGNFIQSPLRFSEVVEGLQPTLAELIGRSKLNSSESRLRSLIALRNGSIPQVLQDIYNKYFQFLQSTFDGYLVHGGYPRAINEMKSNVQGHITPNFFFNVAELLLADCGHAGLDPDNLKRVLQFLLQPLQLSNPLNFENCPIPGIDENARPRSKFSLKSYLDYLKATSSFFFSYREESEFLPNYREKQKLYVLDPFLYHSLCSKIYGEPDPFSKAVERSEDGAIRGLLVESVVASHLSKARQFINPAPGVDPESVLMYHRQDHQEIDFALCISGPRQKDRFLIESKFSNALSSLNKIGAQRIVLSKDILDVRNGEAIIPASLFLLLF